MPSESVAPEGLPVRAHASEIVRYALSRCAMVLVAQTGSGKTTQVPRILHEAGISRDGMIVVLQPRRLAARAVARRVAQEVGTPLGGLVGFRTRYERSESRDTRILFVTDGLFIRLAQQDPELRGVAAVVLDEFHERTIATDVAAGLVRRLRQGSRPDLVAVVMSATLEGQSLARAFGAQHIEIPGRLHRVEVTYAGDSRPGDDPCARAAEVAVDALGRGDGDTLIFMPGRREITETIGALERRLGGRPFDICALHGSQTAEEQDLALAPSARRKIVVATNIAETSLTIPGVTLVIDSGLARVHRFDPLRDLNALRLEPISVASARQRAGRAGRTAPGRCVRLWSTTSEHRREAFDTPELHRIDLSEPMLWLAAMGERDPLAFPWIDAPRDAALARARGVLVECGALDERGALTAMGRSMSRLPAHPRIARALVEAARRGCVDRAALWAAIIGERDCAERAEVGWLRDQLQAGDLQGDLLARERAITASQRPVRHSQLDRDAVFEVRRAAEDLARAASRLTLPTAAPSHAADGEDESIAACFMLGFPDRIAWRFDRHKPHATMASRRKVAVDKRSLHNASGALLSFEVRETGSGDSKVTTLSLITPLEREWVERALPGRFSSRREDRWEPSTQSIEEVEETCFDGIAIERTVRPPRDLANASSLLADRMVAESLHPDDWVESAKPWLDRVAWVRESFPERPIPAFDADDLRVVFGELARGCSRFSQVQSRPTRDALARALSHEEREFIDRMAPATIRLPGGFAMKVAYAPGQSPRARAKIQDFYGLNESPRVGGGRTVVLLEILGPNSRPLQVTADLAGFWKTLYPQIRGDLKRRYPRHTWI